MAPIRPVILSGGSGTRLWPLSTSDTPKQFAALIGDRSLFGLTLSRLDGIEDLAGAIVVTGGAHADLVAGELASSPIPIEAIVVEPEGRNTAPAAVAASFLAGVDDILVILPSDHLISDDGGFRDAVARACDHAATGSVVTFGIQPTRPEAGYGYLELGARRGDGHLLAGFTEKPPTARAIEFFQGGKHLWNSGVFVVRADTLISEAEEHCPDVLEAVRESIPPNDATTVRLGEAFTSSPSISIDHAIMEKTRRGIVLPLDVGWSDVGSYRSLLDAMPRDADGNYLFGDVTTQAVTNSYVKATSRRVVVAGVEGLVVVETPDVVLVIPVERSQDVRDIPQRASPS